MAAQNLPDYTVEARVSDDISEDCAKMISEINISADGKSALMDIAENFPIETEECSTMHSIFMFLQDSNHDPSASKESMLNNSGNSNLKRLPPGLLSPARITPLRSVCPARLIWSADVMEYFFVSLIE